MTPRLGYSKWQFGVFRLTFGLYLLCAFYLALAHQHTPWMNHLMGHGFEPFSHAMMWVLCVASLLYALGIQRRILSVVLMIGWALANMTLDSIAISQHLMILWLLIVTSITPHGDALRIAQWTGSNPWALSPGLYNNAWWIMVTTYAWMAGHQLMLGPGNGQDWLMLGLTLGVCLCGIIRRPWAWILMVFMVLLNGFFFMTPIMLIGHIIYLLFLIHPHWWGCSNASTAIVFFDGVCGLCNGWVDFLMDIDHHQQLTFSPLQGTSAAQYMSVNPHHLTTIVYFKTPPPLTKSTAVLAILKDMGGLWALMSVCLSVIPRFIRDIGYQLVASNRYIIVKKRSQCRRPSPDQRARFLD